MTTEWMGSGVYRKFSLGSSLIVFLLLSSSSSSFFFGWALLDPEVTPQHNPPNTEEATDQLSPPSMRPKISSLSDEVIMTEGLTLPDGTYLPPPDRLNFTTTHRIIHDYPELLEMLPATYIDAAMDINMQAILDALALQYTGPYRMRVPSSRHYSTYPGWYYDMATSGALPRVSPNVMALFELEGKTMGFIGLQKYPPLRLPFQPVYAQIEYDRPPSNLPTR